VVEEYEGAHHVVVRVRQHPAYLEAPEIAPPLIDQHGAHWHRDWRAASAAVRQSLGRTALENVRQRLSLIGE